MEEVHINNELEYKSEKEVSLSGEPDCEGFDIEISKDSMRDLTMLHSKSTCYNQDNFMYRGNKITRSLMKSFHQIYENLITGS